MRQRQKKKLEVHNRTMTRRSQETDLEIKICNQRQSDTILYITTQAAETHLPLGCFSFDVSVTGVLGRAAVGRQDDLV